MESLYIHHSLYFIYISVSLSKHSKRRYYIKIKCPATCIDGNTKDKIIHFELQSEDKKGAPSMSYFKELFILSTSYNSLLFWGYISCKDKFLLLDQVGQRSCKQGNTKT